MKGASCSSSELMTQQPRDAIHARQRENAIHGMGILLGVPPAPQVPGELLRPSPLWLSRCASLGAKSTSWQSRYQGPLKKLNPFGFFGGEGGREHSNG